MGFWMGLGGFGRVLERGLMGFEGFFKVFFKGFLRRSGNVF